MNNKVILIACVIILCVTSCTNLPKEPENSPEPEGKEDMDSLEGSKESINIDRLTLKIKQLMNDDIWFYDVHSSFYFLLQESFEFEYYIDESKNEIYMKTISPVLDSYGSYYIISVPMNESTAFELFDYAIQYNRDWEKHLSEIPVTYYGTGKIELIEITQPQYDVSLSEFEKTSDTIVNSFKTSNFDFDDPQLEIYIRYYYEGGDSTYILYSYDGGWWYANADIATGRIFKPFLLEEEYVEKFKLVSCKVK